jgi:hypothetical protein
MAGQTERVNQILEDML